MQVIFITALLWLLSFSVWLAFLNIGGGIAHSGPINFGNITIFTHWPTPLILLATWSILAFFALRLWHNKSWLQSLSPQNFAMRVTITYCALDIILPIFLLGPLSWLFYVGQVGIWIGYFLLYWIVRKIASNYLAQADKRRPKLPKKTITTAIVVTSFLLINNAFEWNKTINVCKPVTDNIGVWSQHISKPSGLISIALYKGLKYKDGQSFNYDITNSSYKGMYFFGAIHPLTDLDIEQQREERRYFPEKNYIQSDQNLFWLKQNSYYTVYTGKPDQEQPPYWQRKLGYCSNMPSVSQENTLGGCLFEFTHQAVKVEYDIQPESLANYKGIEGFLKSKLLCSP